MRKGWKAAAATGALSLAGMLLSHMLSYFLASPDHLHRDALLTATGHDPRISFGLIAFALGVAGVAAVVGSAGSSAGLPITWGRVAALQTVAFVLLEVWERASVHVSAIELLGEPVFVAGLLIQILVAGVAAWLASVLRRVITILKNGTPSTGRAPRLVGRAPRTVFRATRSSRRAWSLRGPPPMLA